MHVFYLHGFASSARSTKAAYFRDRLAAHGLELHCPDFNEPDFSTLTVSRMIGQVEARIAALPAAPIVLIGSSLGGFAAAHLAARRPASEGDHLVLLAPAFEFAADGMRGLIGERLDEWRATNRLDVFHHAYGRWLPVGYALYEDALHYDSETLDIRQPVVVFQGRHDDAVDADSVARWCAARPQVRFFLLDDDHQLMSSLDFMWRETARFLGLTASDSAGSGA